MGLLLTLWLTAIFPGWANGQTSPKTPYQLKALFLFHFARYTEWPKEAWPAENQPFVLGILGNDPFGKDIDIINGKTVKDRKLVVKYFSTVEEVAGCQLLFIASSETNQLAQILKALEKTSILTIAEGAGFLEANGMISLVTEQKGTGTQTVGFEINLPAAQKANLKLDAQLLKLARNAPRP